MPSHRPRYRPISAAALLVIALASLVASCDFPVETRGNDPAKKTLAEIKPGVTDKASVTRLLGSPSSVAAFDHNTWYYISQKTQNEAFFKPQLRNEKVVSITFNNKGIVQHIAYLGMKNHRDITPNPNATPAPGREFTILEQLIGNFGRFSAPTRSANGPSPTSGPP